MGLRIVRYGGTLHQRLAKLEAGVNILSTEDKWKAIERRALQLTSNEDLIILEEMVVLRDAGKEIEQTPERKAVSARYDEAYMTALAEQNVRFTIPELDELLEAD